MTWLKKQILDMAIGFILLLVIVSLVALFKHVTSPSVSASLPKTIEMKINTANGSHELECFDNGKDSICTMKDQSRSFIHPTTVKTKAKDTQN